MNNKYFLKYLKNNWLGIIVSIIIIESLGFLSSKLTGDISSIYNQLNLPIFSPPNIIFPIVWSVLYAFMGIAIYIIINSDANIFNKAVSLALFLIQLLLNLSWTVIFFKFELFGIGIIIIIAIVILVTIMLLFFYDISKFSALLMIPYIIWLLIAFYLAVGVYILN